MPHTFINCLSGQWGGVQHKWYQGSKSCLIYFAGVVCKMYCPALVNKSRAGQGTLVSISRNIIHGTKAAALVTKSYSNQDKGSISLLLTLGQISCNVRILPHPSFATWVLGYVKKWGLDCHARPNTPENYLLQCFPLVKLCQHMLPLVSQD